MSCSMEFWIQIDIIPSWKMLTQFKWWARFEKWLDFTLFSWRFVRRFALPTILLLALPHKSYLFVSAVGRFQKRQVMRPAKYPNFYISHRPIFQNTHIYHMCDICVCFPKYIWAVYRNLMVVRTCIMLGKKIHFGNFLWWGFYHVVVVVIMIVMMVMMMIMMDSKVQVQAYQRPRSGQSKG